MVHTLNLFKLTTKQQIIIVVEAVMKGYFSGYNIFFKDQIHNVKLHVADIIHMELMEHTNIFIESNCKPCNYSQERTHVDYNLFYREQIISHYNLNT